MSHRGYKQQTKTENIYIAHLQGAILCYVFLYVFCFDFIFISFTFYFGHNQGCKYKKKKHTTLKIYCNKVNLTAPSRRHVGGKKSKVMCNASYICMCALSHVHADPYSEVPRDINH